MPRLLRVISAVTLLGLGLFGANRCLADPAGILAACTLGETHLPSTTIFSFNVPQYSVFQLARPAECASCSPSAVVLQSATWRMRFFAFCTVTVEISVVAAVDAACPHPDTTVVLCGPITFQHTPTTLSAGENVVFPMPSGCCITGPAFVRLKMLDTGSCASNQLIPYQYFPLTCTTCSSYSLPPGMPLDDSCVFPGALHTISVQADCCGPTPTTRESWGRIKTIYR